MKHVVFLEKEFLLRDSGSKVELEEVQDAKTNTDQLLEPKANIHKDKIVVGFSKAQALRMSSRIRTVPERYGFLISELNDVLFIEDDEPTTYEAYLKCSEYDKWLIAMKLKINFMYETKYGLWLTHPMG